MAEALADVQTNLSLDKSVSIVEKSTTSPKKSATSNVERTPLFARTKAPPPNVFLFKKRSKAKDATQKSVTTSKKSSSEPIEIEGNSTSLSEKSPTVPLSVLALNAQLPVAKELRKGAEYPSILDTNLE